MTNHIKLNFIILHKMFIKINKKINKKIVFANILNTAKYN